MYDDTLASKRSIRQYFNIVYKRLPIILGDHYPRNGRRFLLFVSPTVDL